MHNFLDLEPYGENQQLRMVVETPRGSNIKLEYEAELRAFTVSRALPLGLVYPYDWGFIPGTKGEDGDPIDTLAIHDGSTYPGVILPCRPLGVVELVQKGANGPIENPRLILMPIWHDRMGELKKVTDLPARM
jgi:inorganic pyrophosphatase